MKHLVFLLALTLAGAVGAFYSPAWAALLYYGLSVLRPQYLWKWSLPVEWRWSLFAWIIMAVSVGSYARKLLPKARLTLIAGLMAVYAALLALSWLTAYDPALADRWGDQYLKVLVAGLLAMFCLTELWHLRLLALIVVAATGYLAYEVNYLYLVEHRLDIFHYGYGGLDNNGAGLMLAMGLPLVLVLALWSARWWQKGLAALAGLLILHAVLMSYSRGAMLAALLGLGWVLVFIRPRWRVAVVVVVLGGAVALMAGEQIRQRFASTASYAQDRSANSRLDSWAAAWAIAWDHPLLGTGIRNSNLFTQAYGADIAGRTIHSQYLQIAADSGIPAAMIYCALIGASLAALGRGRRLLLEAGGTLQASPRLCGERRPWRSQGGEGSALGPGTPAAEVRGRMSNEDPSPDRPSRSCLSPQSRGEAKEPPTGRWGMDTTGLPGFLTVSPRREVELAAGIALGCQASLLTFAFGALFLSLEVFELPWLLMVVAAVLPGIVLRNTGLAQRGRPVLDPRTRPRYYQAPRRSRLLPQPMLSRGLRATRGVRGIRGDRGALPR